MIFGEVPVEEAVGAIAAHTVRAGGIIVKKGSPITPEAAAGLRAAGIERVVAARLESGDVAEDKAALRLSHAVAGTGVTVERPFTGRSNLFALTPGVLVVDRAGIDRVNALDEAITVATLPAFKPVVTGEMVGTVKIIPYAVPGAALDRAVEAAAGGAVRVAPYRRTRVGVVSTMLPGLKETVVAKTLDVLGERLGPTGAVVASDVRVPHMVEPLAAALSAQAREGAELVVVFGASAVADRRDVVPAAIAQAGGHVDHLGMPVDPGNLLLVGRIGDAPIIGAPGCARSPKENGFDWILHRLLADLPVTRADIMRLGVGGLLMEIVSRGQPRAGGESGVEG
ncbi:molybdopterin-binding protein [Salinarimonas soli]|uniref:Molybdopterin-binding protein n=1 Tax=Salinarimonas soli TaxID=1638099 RepID=A0A5B2VZQ0_9HYPH|nr:molybdopterin-binding protein [Salinarimonas soli]KAA2244168.1 molybdopterin-binding protein [Salinarimonas soli]